MSTIVAQAEVDIANSALSNLGISTQIDAFTDKTEPAKACAFWYPKMRNYALRSAPWNFAYTCIALASDSSVAPGQPTPPTFGVNLPFPGWPYAYQYPNDCLQSIAVTTSAGQRLGPAFWSNWWWPYPAMNYAIPKVPTKIVQSFANPGQLMILCDIQATAGAPLYMFYIQCVTNTAQFDVMFTDYLGWLLGWRVGMTLRSADKAKVQYCQSMAEKMRLEALAQDLNESQQDAARDSPSVLARS